MLLGFGIHASRPAHNLLRLQRLAWLGSLLAAAAGAPGPLASADPPDPPALNSPPQDEQAASPEPTLSVTATDSSGSPLSVSFYGRAVAGPDFTLVPIPDTQNYTGAANYGLPQMLDAQMQWILANQDPRNIVYAVQMGDCVERGQNNGNPIEWQRADASFRAIEDSLGTGLLDGIPYGVCVGNHDQTPNGEADGSTEFYNQYFGSQRFQGRAYYGGHFGANNDNWFDLFSASGMDFIVVSFEYDTTPDSEVLDWGDSLLTAYADRRAIVVSHHLCGVGNPASFHPQGQAIYNRLRTHPNLFLMLAAHVLGEGRRQDVFGAGTIHTLTSNYQDRPNGGDGWLRFMEFSPRDNVIRVRSYSPWLDEWEADADSSSQFTLAYDMTPQAPYELLGTVTDLQPGGRAEITWHGLHPYWTYDWYATVDNGAASTGGPAWRFRTSDGTPPVVRVISPNGAEALEAGQTVTFHWKATDDVAVARVNLLLSRDGPGGTFETIAENIPSRRRFDWTVTGPTTTDACFKVVAYDAAANAGEDVSDAPFAIDAVTGVGPEGPRFALRPVTPNPAHGAAQFVFEIPTESVARLEILDLQGRRVARLADGRFEPGRYGRTWPAAGAGRVPAGLYLARMSAAGRVIVRRFMLLP